MADAQCDQEPGKGAGLGFLEVNQELVAVGGQPATGGGEERSSQEGFFGEAEQVPFVDQQAGLQQGGAGLIAKVLDIQGAPAGDMEQPLAQLRGAGAMVGAAEIGVAFSLVLQLRAAG